MNYIKKYHLSILTALFIVVVSLVNPHKISGISKSLMHADKIIHAGIYFFFMAIIVYESRLSLTKIKLLLLSAVPIIFGIIMELSQIFLTNFRTGSIADILANIFGISMCVIICLFYSPVSKKIFR
jgi:VanZ family protein